jgi:Bacterial membrane protein YfhO
MLLFAMLPLAPAAKAYLLFHPLLAATSSYALASALGLRRLGAFVTALAYANSGFLQIQNSCCFAFASVYAWLPLALLGAEGAIRSTSWTTRGGWWGLAALAFSQIVAAWLGQGTYYAALIIGGYIAYRTLFVPPAITHTSLWVRIGRFLQHETAIFSFGGALAAAGLLPRVEFISLSNLAGGYAGAAGRVGGLRPEQWVFLLLPGMWYVGTTVLVLAAAAPLLVGRRLAGTVWYFGATSLIALILTDTFETPLDQILYHLLPGFEHLHPHAPERILTVAYLGPALLAGATVSALTESAWWRWRISAVVSTRVVAALVLGVVTLDLAVGGAKARADRAPRDPLNGIATLVPVDLPTFYQPSGAASFLQQQLAVSSSRFAGYAPDVDGRRLAYTVRSFEPGTANLLVNNRAVALGIQDIQGYDATQLRRYDDYFAVLNGQTQDYHDADVFPQGLSSPLLDLLNACYLIVPRADHVDPADASPVLQRYSEVYADHDVRLLENPSALPRAWIVHAATQLGPRATSAPALIASGEVDPRHTAVLEETPPPLEIPSDPSLDQVRVTHQEADRLDISALTTATGLLVLSEVYYPAWKAYVDDQPTHLYVADGLLRAVPVPPGEHKVELRYESAQLAIGVVISTIASLLLVLLELAALIVNRTQARGFRLSACYTGSGVGKSRRRGRSAATSQSRARHRGAGTSGDAGEIRWPLKKRSD